MFALPVEFDLVLEEAAVEAGGSRKIGQHSTGDICPSREEHSRDGDDIMSIVFIVQLINHTDNIIHLKFWQFHSGVRVFKSVADFLGGIIGITMTYHDHLRSGR